MRKFRRAALQITARLSQYRQVEPAGELHKTYNRQTAGSTSAFSLLGGYSNTPSDPPLPSIRELYRSSSERCPSTDLDEMTGVSYHNSLELVPTSGNYGCDPVVMWNDQKERMGLLGLFGETPEVKFFFEWLR